MSWVESKEKKGAETPITAIISHVTLREVLDGESNDGVLLLLRARPEARILTLCMSKRVVCFMHPGYKGDSKSFSKLTLKLHGHLGCTTSKAKLPKCLGVTIKEVDDTLANCVIGVAFEAVSVKESRASLNKALEVGEVAINEEIRSNSILQPRLNLGFGIEVALYHLGDAASEGVADRAGCGSEEFHVS
jgi:hypothetical protein